MTLKDKLHNSKFYVLLSNINSKHIIIEKTKLLLDGGADIIQLREKTLPDNEFMNIANELQKLISKYETIFIVNDRVNLAEKIQADGVHIGQNDMKTEGVRQILQKDKIVGISTHNIKQFKEASESMADYIAIGPIFPTTTKKHEPTVGIAFAQEVKKYVQINGNETKKHNKPIFAIGGINNSNIKQVLKTGITRVAISSAIVAASDIKKNTKEFKALLNLT